MTLPYIKDHYRSGRDELGRDFFSPCLAHCVTYLRAVAYFSSSALSSWASALPRVTSSNDELQINLIISPLLSSRDKEALANASDPERKTEIIQEIADQILSDAILMGPEGGPSDRHLRLFQWMVATDRLHIRFAFPEHVEDPGDYHEKYGIFEFPDENKVAFTGSANETSSGYSRNFEYIDVFRSWHDVERNRVATKVEQFWEAWHNNTQGLVVEKPSREVLARVRERAPENPPRSVSENPAVYDHLWNHQQEAISTFLAEGSGILEMATGTGKTRTSLEIMERLIKDDLVGSVVIATDNNDLLDQWYREVIPVARKNGLAVTRHYGGSRETEEFAMNPERRIHICSRANLPRLLDVLAEAQALRTLIVHDEVHGLGSYKNRVELTPFVGKVGFQLGLSATPERTYDEEGNKFLDEFVGPTIFQYTLQDAIRDRILAPFSYTPVEWVPSDEDKQKISAVYRMSAAREAQGNAMPDEEIWQRIASVYKESAVKLPLFERLVESDPDLIRQAIVFVPTIEYGNRVAEIVQEYTRRFRTYFSDANPEALDRFSRGRLDTLIACHRLSQGIDVRSISSVVLMSSDRSQLESVQRIGRCLRRNPQEPDKVARVVDFVRVPNSEEAEEYQEELEKIPDTARRRWLEAAARVSPGGAKTDA